MWEHWCLNTYPGALRGRSRVRCGVLESATLFEKARELSRQHEDLIAGLPGSNHFVSFAIEERLAQLDLILDMVRQRHSDFIASPPLDTQDQDLSDQEARERLRPGQEIEMLHVAFFYLANSITTIIEHNPLPYLEQFRAPEIGFVRNQLLEHFRPDPDAPFARILVLDAGGPRFTKQGQAPVGMRSSGGLYESAEKLAKATGELFERAVIAAEQAKQLTDKLTD
jgi:hypothetical protein